MMNEEIIFQAAIASGLYTEEEAAEVIENKGELPLHSLMGWKLRSPINMEYRVKSGEHGIEACL